MLPPSTASTSAGLQALFHEGRLKILRELDEAETLVRELQDYRVEFTAARHLTFNARSGKPPLLLLPLDREDRVARLWFPIILRDMRRRLDTTHHRNRGRVGVPAAS